MRYTTIIALGGLCLLASCSNEAGYKKYAEYKATDSAISPIPAPAAKPDNTAKLKSNSPELADKKVILTADYQCNVADVFTSVKALEALVKSQGGVIQESNMKNEIGPNETTDKGDSILQYHTYSTIATLVLKVPSGRFDSIVHAIPAMAQFIDSRSVKEDDITLQFYGNQLRANAAATSVGEIKGINTEKKDALAIARYKDEKQEAGIDHQIGNMELMANVTYATVTVKFTQPQQVYTQTILNPESLTAGHFGADCMNALSTSLYVVKAIFLAFITIWPVLLMVLAAILIVRYARKNKGKKMLA